MYWDEALGTWHLQRPRVRGIVEDLVNWDIARYLQDELIAANINAQLARYPERDANAGPSGNARWQEGAKYLAGGEVDRFGDLMRESHRSLRDLFEVSCRELDVMAEAAESLEGYCGGRMTGGGFGGCTVNLVKTGDAQEFANQIAERYQATIGIKPDIYVCSAANGASAGPGN